MCMCLYLSELSSVYIMIHVWSTCTPSVITYMFAVAFTLSHMYVVYRVFTTTDMYDVRVQ